MILTEFIDREQHKPLDKDDIIKMSFRNGLKHYYYNDIGKGTTLKQLLPSRNSGRLILFAKKGTDVGHFCLLFNNERSGLHFFDPYGFGLKKVIDLTGSDHRLQYIIRGKDIHINKHEFQKMKDSKAAINTCGRHCITRWNCANMKPNEYESFLHHHSMNPDEIVTMLTCEQDLSKLKF